MSGNTVTDVATPAGIPGVQATQAKDLLKAEYKHIDEPGGMDRMADTAATLHRDADFADRAVAAGIGGAATKAIALYGDLSRQADATAREYLPDALVDVAEGVTKWTLPKVLGAFDLPRAYAWKLAAEAGSYLPDSNTETGQWIADRTGAALQDLGNVNWASPLGKVAGDAMARAAYDYIGAPVAGGNGDEDAYAQEVAEAGKRLYAAFADGTLAQRAVTHVADVEYPGGWHPSQLTAEDLLDLAVPKEAAERLAASATDPTDKRFWSMLATNTGRAATDLAAQVVLDPLWFMGAADGSKLVAADNKLMRASMSAVGDVSAVARQAGVDDITVFTALANDAAHGTQTAAPVLAQAKLAARAAEAAAQATNDAKAVRTAQEDLRRIGRLADEVQNGQVGRRIVAEGVGKYVIPGDETQRYLFQAEGATAKAAGRASEALGKLVMPPSIERLEHIADEIASKRMPDTALTNGEKLALWGARAGRATWEIPQLAWETAGRMFGSRAFHATFIPAYGKRSNILRAADKAGRPLGRSAAFGLARRVTSANPEQWSRYVHAVEEATSAMAARKQQLLHSVTALTTEAKRVFQERQATGRSPAGYTLDNVMTEAMDLAERGAGKADEALARHPEMANLVHIAQLIVKDVADAIDVPLSHARQALQSMERSMSADFLKYDEIARRLSAGLGYADHGAALWNAEHATRSALETGIQALPTGQARARLEQIAKDLNNTARPLLPQFGGDLRELHPWERDLYRRYAQTAEALNFGVADRLQAVMLLLRDEHVLPSEMPGATNPSKLGGPAGWQQDYTTILGQRYGDIPDEMKPLVELTRQFIGRYEEMYQQAGLEIVKSPYLRMKSWGVVDYVPHVLDQKAAVQQGRMMAASGSGASFHAAGDLDARLSTDMDARKLRSLAGAISEINDAAGAAVLSINPEVVLARYGQANDAVGASEFLISLMQSKVLRAMTREEAAKLDYVPLLNRHERTRAYDILVHGLYGRHDALTPAEIQQGLAALRRGKVAEGDAFAAWVNEVPLIQRGNTIERQLFELNAARALTGQAPIQDEPWLASLIAAAKNGQDVPVAAWDEAANGLNAAYYDHLRAQNIPEPTVVAGRTTGAWLKEYYTGDARHLYAPADVVQNVNDAFDIASELPKPGSFTAKLKWANDAYNNFVKMRLTLINTPFPFRNFVQNMGMNVAALGHAALNPHTQLQSGRLAIAAHYLDAYGSLEEAERVLSQARRAGESAAAYAGRRADAGIFATMVRPLIAQGIDFGDGVVRNASEALQELQKRGVLTGAYTDFHDLMRWEQAQAELYNIGKAESVGTMLRKAAEHGEFAAYAFLASAAQGGGIPLTVVPKKLGAAMSNYTENVTRLVNFIANVKKSRSIDYAASEVSKWLFNYDSLSAFQKVWLRSAFLFYSWPQRNLLLHAQLLHEKPVYYALLNTGLVTEGPDLIDAYRADSAGHGDDFYHRSRNTPQQEALLRDNEVSRFRVPTMRSPNVMVSGLGSGVEAALDQIDTGTNLLTGNPRVLAGGSALVRTLAEWTLNESFYHGKSYDDLTSGTQVGQVLGGLTEMAEQAPAPAAKLILFFRDAIAAQTGWKQVNNQQVITPRAAKFMGNFPWRPVISNAAALTDVYHVGVADESAGAGPSAPVELSMDERAADAFLGLSFTQVDEMRRAAAAQRAKKEALLDLLEERKIVTKHELFSPTK